jgi:two-component system KDP operon response regulator KdpE
MSMVLLIDDEPQMARLIGMSLEDLGVEMVHVTDLPGAIEASRKKAPDVVLLDIALGEEDGLEMLPSLRAEAALKDVPVVVCSVHESRRDEALEGGAAGFIPRPFKGATLRATLEPYLRR